MHRLTIYACLQSLSTRQPTWSILVAQPCIPIEVFTCHVLEVCRVGQRSGVESMLLPHYWEGDTTIVEGKDKLGGRG